MPSSRTFAEWSIYDHIIESKAEMHGTKGSKKNKETKQKKLTSDKITITHQTFIQQEI